MRRTLLNAFPELAGYRPLEDACRAEEKQRQEYERQVRAREAERQMRKKREEDAARMKKEAEDRARKERERREEQDR